jgi:hypothetical protein
MMSKGFQHFLPVGLMTATLFWLVERRADGFIGFLFPREVSTLKVIGFHLFAFGFSAGCTLVVLLPVAWLMDEIAQEATRWVWTLAVVIPLTALGGFWLSARTESSLSYLLFGAIFLTSLFCATYCGVLWLGRLLFYLLPRSFKLPATGAPQAGSARVG